MVITALQSKISHTYLHHMALQEIAKMREFFSSTCAINCRKYSFLRVDKYVDKNRDGIGVSDVLQAGAIRPTRCEDDTNIRERSAPHRYPHLIPYSSI